MEKKVCSKCKIDKELCEFQKNKHSKNGYRSECSECSKLIKKLKSKNIINQYHKNYRNKNREKYNEKQKKYYWNNKEKENKRVKKYKEKQKRIKNKEKPEKIKNIYVPWRVKNKVVFNQKRRERYKTDVKFRLSQNIRNRMNMFISSNNFSKKNKTFELIGCSPEDLKKYLEKKFYEGMSWDNRNLWDIDHIIPLSSAKTIEDIEKLSHYTNLQPLWRIENLKKGSKIL